jgi:hypothetical protein
VKPIVIHENFCVYVAVVAGFCYALMYYCMRGLMASARTTRRLRLPSCAPRLPRLALQHILSAV